MTQSSSRPTSKPAGASRSSAGSQWVEIVEQVSRHARMLRRVLADRIASLGVSEPQFSILWACTKAPPAGVPQHEIAAGLAVSPAHVSGLLEQLRTRGLLESQRQLKDRRKQLWTMTAEGESIVQSILAQLERALEGSLSDYSAWPETLQMLSQMLCQRQSERTELRLHDPVSLPASPWQRGAA